MKTSGSVLALSAVLFALPSLAQVAAGAGLITSTLPWANGNTVVISTGTDALGGAITSTILTVTAGAAAGTVTTTPLVAPTTTNPLIAPTTTAKTRAVTTTATGPVTTTQRVVGNTPTSDGIPMRTTTYWYDPGNGVFTSGVWTASNTANPTAATANVASGSIQDYGSYQSSANSVVFASATASQGVQKDGVTGAGMRSISSSSTGWLAIGAGAAGAMLMVFFRV